MQDVLHVVGTGAAGEPRIITFGGAGRAGTGDDLAALARRFLATAASRSPSPARSPRRSTDGVRRSGSPTRHAVPLLRDDPTAPPASLPEALERHVADLSLAVRGCEGEVEAVRSVQLSRASNAVATSVGALPPEVVRGLAEDESLPFLFFRHLTACFIEVCTCTTFR